MKRNETVGSRGLTRVNIRTKTICRMLISMQVPACGKP